MDEKMVQLAVSTLGVDVPVLAWRVVGDRLELYLYGGARLYWQIPAGQIPAGQLPGLQTAPREGEAAPARQAQPAKPPRKRGAQ